MKAVGLAASYYSRLGYNCVISDMKQQYHHGYINVDNGFVSSIVQSQDLINDAHIS